MNSKKYNVILDIYKGVLNNQLIEFTTEDYGKCVLQFELLEDKLIPYDLTGCIVRMLITGQQQDCTIIDASTGKIEIALQQSMFSVSGPIIAELQIYDELNQTLRLTTPRFRYNVRKSLMDDATAQADPAFSLLQNMILEVSNANTVANQAKATAEGALATANLAESKATQIMANGDYAKAQGDYAKAQGEKFDRVLTLDGASQTNFDFIRSKVVQDGLSNTLNTSDDLTIMLRSMYVSGTSIFVGLHIGTTKGFYFNILGNSNKIQLVYASESGLKTKVTKFTPKNEVLNYTIVKKGTNITLAIGEEYETFVLDGMIDCSAQIDVGNISFNTYSAIGYQRVITSEEVRSNLQTLNNSPSISEITITNTDGTKSPYKLASNSEHVVMRNGYNAEECLSGVYDMCKKEFSSNNPEHVDVNGNIVIPNAIDKSKILGGSKISGQTVKNYANGECTGDILLNNTIYKAIGNRDISFSSEEKCFIAIDILELPTGTSEIEIGYKVNNTTSKVANISVKSIGIVFYEITESLPYNLETYRINGTQASAGNFVRIKNMTITKQKVYKTFIGLSSTQAILDCNGMKYTFYLKDGTPIILRGVGNVRDTFDIKDDGSGVYEKKLKYYSTENHIALKEGAKGTNVDIFLVTCTTDSSRISSTARISTNSFINPSGTAWDTTESLYGIYLSSGSSTHTDIGIAFPKGSTIDDVRSYLNANIIEAISSLEVPIAITIPKELTPTIGLNKTNICKVDSAVAPSELKIVAPVDRVAELTARLEALEAKTNTQPVNTAFVEETYAKSVNKIEEVIK